MMCVHKQTTLPIIYGIIYVGGIIKIMLSKTKEKEQVIQLRKQGLSYAEIMKQIPVAKSSVCLWLQSVGLAGFQNSYTDTEKRKSARQKAYASCRQKRLNKIEYIEKQAHEELIAHTINDDTLFFIGIMLYWAEGAKIHTISGSVSFINTDPSMLRIFILWLNKFFNVQLTDLIFRVQIHETGNTENSKIWWSQQLNIPSNYIKHITLKKHNIIRKYTVAEQERYHGTMQITVKRSTDLIRKITGYIKSVSKILTA